MNHWKKHNHTKGITSFYVITILFILFSSIFITGQATDKKKSSAKKVNDSLKTKVEAKQLPQDYFNTVASLLCGKNLPSSSINIDTAFLKKYQDEMRISFKEIYEKRLQPMLLWNKGIISDSAVSSNKNVVYPFAGGDFLHLFYMFPDADNYTMLTMESPGTIPDLTTYTKKKTQDYLSHAKYMLRDIFKRSYFITMNLGSDLGKNSSLINGLLPLLLWSIEISDNTIIDVQSADIDNAGYVITTPFQVGKASKHSGVKILFKTAAGSVKSLLYYSCDISNDGMKKQRGLCNYLDSLNTFNSYAKSASYLLHGAAFSTMRNILLTKSVYHLQDDTGIPFHFFNNDKWIVKLFGDYDKPIRDFSSSLFQADLKKAYSSKSLYCGKIDFSLGYHWKDKKQNQMAFIRKYN